MKDRKKPTEAELGILRVLWTRGPSTVREVAESMGREGAYTTVLKLLQIMTDKGLTTRAPLGLQHVYTARRSEQDTQQQLLRDLLDRAFDGSTSQLVMQALAARQASPGELKEIRKLIAAAAAKPQEKKP
jgi:predicted transcriptional regulator